MENDYRHFSYFLFESFDAHAESGNPLNPRNLLNASVDSILSWTADTPTERRTFHAACKRFGEDSITRLIDSGILRKDNQVLFFDTPVFLSEDAEKLASFFSVAATRFVRLIREKEQKLYELAGAVKNGFSAQINLYHIICGMCFDGLFLDRLSEAGILSNSRWHKSGLDYLAVIYEKCSALERFSNNLLCSYNRIQNDVCALQSFGDANGNRPDCYRFFRLREKNLLPPEFASIKETAANLSEDDLLIGLSDILNKKHVDPMIAQSLESFGYLKNGHICVPVFSRKDSDTIRTIESFLEDILLRPIGEWLSDLSALKITAVSHGVANGEIANECWHILFGCMNEILVSTGVVAKPPFKAGEGRYLQSIEVYR